MAVTADILEAFGVASGLRVNQSKSAAFAIRCSDDQKILVGQSLGFLFSHFPCKYLGLPLTIRKQTSAQLQYLVDQLARRLPTWRGSAMPKSGRLLLVQAVLCAICWKYALEAIINRLLLYFLVHDNRLLSMLELY